MNKRDITWNNMYNSVKSYHANNGRWPASYSLDKDEKKLGQWCINQKQKQKTGKLSDIRKQMLDAIGFVWRVNFSWFVMFESLKLFREKTGKWPYSLSGDNEEKRLGDWLYRQRAIAKGKKKYKMPQDHLEKLESIDFMKCDYRGKKK